MIWPQLTGHGTLMAGQYTVTEIERRQHRTTTAVDIKGLYSVILMTDDINMSGIVEPIGLLVRLPRPAV